MSGKSDVGHKHSAGDITSGTISISRLPVSSQQINSTSYIPTSSLVYSMNSTVSGFDSRITNIENNYVPYIERKWYGTFPETDGGSLGTFDHIFNFPNDIVPIKLVVIQPGLQIYFSGKSSATTYTTDRILEIVPNTSSIKIFQSTSFAYISSTTSSLKITISSTSFSNNYTIYAFTMTVMF